MKSWNKGSGWLVKLVGGPGDGAFRRTWALTGDPHREVEEMPERFSVSVSYGNGIGMFALDTRGEYVRVKTFDKKGNRKMAKVGGQRVPMYHYQWTTFEEEAAA